MAQRSSIEWTDATWNPVRGCTKVSPGCTHCYAERFAERWRGTRGHPYENGFDLRLVPDRLLDPLRWKEQRTIFVNSMSDLFHDDVSSAYIRAVFEVMYSADWHIYQLLTKRAERMRYEVRNLPARLQRLPNVWLGTSVEDSRFGLPRVAFLRETPAAIRFLSIEPLLESLPALDVIGLDWVIVGGESGPGARALEPEWVRDIRRKCRAARVPFFFKQWGGTRKHVTGRSLDGRTYDEVPVSKAGEPPTIGERSRKRLAIEKLLQTIEAVRSSNARRA